MKEDQIKKRILIVEDDASLLHGLVDKFTHKQFEVLSAANGAEGLASALENRPQVILLDIIMPQIDGLTMLQKLRETGEWGKSVPVIFLTNLSAENENIMARIATDEPVSYLIKSAVSIQDVVDKVRACFESKALS
jgi:two-component system OmpR family response regulator